MIRKHPDFSQPPPSVPATGFSLGRHEQSRSHLETPRPVAKQEPEALPLTLWKILWMRGYPARERRNRPGGRDRKPDFWAL